MEPLQEWLSGGYKLDARPSMPLIMSIFDPNSPGHDGALIVAKGKFTRFGVRLPVSQSSKLPEELGTRHHAAMGLTEKSDALAIAVSEERGKITIFYKGKFRQVNDREKLVETIISHWSKTASFPFELPEGKARWLVFSQMLVSLTLAVLFWATLIIAQSEILEKIVNLESIYNDTNIFCKIIAPPAVQPVDKRWPDVEVVFKVGY